MKIFNFHLMPYGHADLDAIERNGTAGTTLPTAITIPCWAPSSITATSTSSNMPIS